MHRVRIASLVLLLLAGLVASFAPATASASTEWCWRDPVVKIGTEVVTINVGVQGRSTAVRKHVQTAHITIEVPEGVSVSDEKTTSRHFPEVTQFRRVATSWQPGQPVPVTVIVTFDATADMPAAVRIVSVHGTITATGTTQGQIPALFAVPQRAATPYRGG